MKKKKYRSEVLRDKRKNEAYKGDRGTFWADYEPRRDYGTFANERASTFKMNGITYHQ